MPHPLRNRRLIHDNLPDPVIDGYLVNDGFATALAVGAVADTAAEPGPGVRLVVDTVAKLSITGGQLNFAVGGVPNDPQVRYLPALTRIAGRTVRTTVNMAVLGSEVGWESGLAGSLADGLRFLTTGLFARVNTGVLLGVAPVPSTGVNYQVAVALRTAGAWYFIKGGAFANWTLLWVSVAGNYSSVYAAASLAAAAGVFTADDVRVPVALFLPSPVASDGFGLTAFGTTDGAGHAEGIIGALGLGGAGLSWTQAVGTWQLSGGAAAASALSGSLAIATVDTGKADVIATAKVTRAAGNGSVLVRYADTSNFVRAAHNGTNAQLIKRVAGVETTLVDVVTTYVAGAELRVICQGQAFRLYYNDAFIGTEQTITDAGLQSGTRQGIRTTDTGNTFDDFVVYARGAGGEYAALDAF